MLLSAGAVAVLATAAVIPILASAPASSRADDNDGLIPWEISNAVWGECPTQDLSGVPSDYGIQSGTDETGTWQVDLVSANGEVLTEEQVAEAAPEAVDALDAFSDCLNQYPTLPYSPPVELNETQRELYWGYVVSALAPCLRDHGRVIDLSARSAFEYTDYLTWYMDKGGFWNGSMSLEEQLALWHECPVLPSYLEYAPTDGESSEPQQAG
jgi:hypothetical protein